MQPTAWTPGARIGPYVLEQRLGSGGMATVFGARHVETGAPCAIKALTATDPELLLRFEREGQALAAVDRHPHVIGVHAAGSAGGRCYLVLDLVEGGSLADRLAQEGPLPPAEAARLVNQVASAVAHAHAAGVLHRDLKPANVLLDERGDAQLTDFGLASAAWEHSLTRTGDVLGTPGTMAPEQARGDRAAVGPATDVYGLGALLYACLTGQPPFRGGSALAVLDQVLRAPAPSPRALRPEVPAALDRLCRQALAKEPGLRPPSAAAFAAALERGEAPASSRRAGLAAAGALGALGLGAVVLAYPAPARPVDRSTSDLAQPVAADAAAPSLGPEAEADGAEAASAAIDLDVALPPIDALVARTRPLTERAPTLRAPLGMLPMGHQVPCRQLGNKLWDGAERGRRDRPLAVLWWRHAAEAGDAETLTTLARHLVEGRLRSERLTPRELARQAAAAGTDPDAVVFYGEMLAGGVAGPRDLPAALEWFERAARAGSLRAAIHLGRWVSREGQLLEGLGVLSYLTELRRLPNARSDHQELADGALDQLLDRWPALQEATASGDGQPPLAEVLAQRRGPDPIYDQSFGGAEEPGGLRFRGEVFAGRKAEVSTVTVDPAEALRWYFAAATAGDSKAVRLFARAIIDGEGANACPALARALLQEWVAAAGRTDTFAMRLLADLSLSGQGGPKDLPAAARWLQRAGELGDAPALVDLANLHLGQGDPAAATRVTLDLLRLPREPKRHDEALALLRQAAAAGAEEAAAALVELGEEGR